MSIIAMNTNNPLGKRPYGQMGGLAGDFDFPGAPLPWRVPPEMLAGNPAKQGALHPPAIVEQPSPWDADGSVMLLGMGAVTSTQTLVPTTDTTPGMTGAVPSGQPVWSAWFSAQTMIPGLSNWEVLAGGIALIAALKAMR